MKRIIFTLFVICSFSLPSLASEWVNLGGELYLDKASVRYVPKHRTYKAWVKEVKTNETVLYFNEYNLKEREWRNLDKVTTDAQNNIKKREWLLKINITGIIFKQSHPRIVGIII